MNHLLIKVKRGLAALLLTLLVSPIASAGVVSVVADVNAATSSNFSFYDAILGTSQNVMFSRADEQQSAIFNHYNSQAGVTATENASTLTNASLAFTDLLVITRFFNNALNYSAAETSAIADFVTGGGDLLMITEASNSSHLAGYNAILSAVGSSIAYTGFRSTSFQSGIVAESTSLGPLNSFTVSAYNTLSGGTAVYNANNGTVVAFESVSVPAPSALLVLGLGLVLMRTRKQAAA